MPIMSFISFILVLVVAVCSGGYTIAQEPAPVPVPPPVETPQVLPSPPEIQTFAVCGAETKCDCDTVVSVAQA
jgi:hypothetical protein